MEFSPDQGLNLCRLHCQADSLTTGLPGKSCNAFILKMKRVEILRTKEWLGFAGGTLIPWLQDGGQDVDAVLGGL